VIITGVIALGVGVMIGSSGDDTATTAKPNATVTLTETPKAESAPTATKAPEAKKTTELNSKSTMDEGTYEIGVDAKPGRYKTQVPESSPGCYWARMKDDSGGLSSMHRQRQREPWCSRIDHCEARRVLQVRRLRHLDDGLDARPLNRGPTPRRSPLQLRHLIQVSDWLADVCSDSGNDLDPSLMHRLEPLSLLLGILVRDGADGVAAPAVDDLVRMRSDDDLVDQHLGERALLRTG
jgi:hypothetical protein